MSRSRRKNPIAGITCCESEKSDKRIWHKVMRRKTRERLRLGEEEGVSAREVSDPWKMGKDGKVIQDKWDKVYRK